MARCGVAAKCWDWCCHPKISSSGSTEYELKKYLLLLATLVATVTYAAGLNLPGGSWLEDTPEGQLAGDSILRETNYMRYIVFYYFNAISFAASLLVGLLLLVLHEDRNRDWGGWLLSIVRTVMVVDLLCLMGAYGAGSSHDGFTTSCGACLLASGIFFYLSLALFASYTIKSTSTRNGPPPQTSNGNVELETLLVLAIFAATGAYVAGLNPPGGFWRSSQVGHHTAGEPVLQGLHRTRYRAFFFFNATAFVASLLAILLIVSYDRRQQKLWNMPAWVTKPALYAPVVTALLGLGGAYASGSCRDSKHTAYVVGLLLPVVACICLQYVVDKIVACIRNAAAPCIDAIKSRCISYCTNNKATKWLQEFCKPIISAIPIHKMDPERLNDLDKTRENIQLLATLAATIAYLAGVDPPGGVWSEKGEGHNVGDPILLTTHPGRYKVFFYFNSAAFVASLVIMVMLQYENLLRGHALEAAMILDLCGLIGAYAAGSSRDTNTSIYTVALAGAVLIYVVFHIVFFTLGSNKKDDEDQLKKKREVLLLLAILAATLSYQAGLTPPGGLWENDKFGHRAGFPVLQDKYPRRYKAFYYCNAAGFMASIALIVLLLNPNMYKLGIRCYALVVCIVAGMTSLMGAYAAGSSLHLKTSIVVLVLVALVFGILVSLGIKLAVDHCCHQGPEANNPQAAQNLEDPIPNNPQAAQNPEDPKPKNPPVAQGQKSNNEKPKKTKADADADMMAMYLMLVGILAASVTYLAGLKPPGGMWRDDRSGHSAGNPVLYDVSKHRYNVFFYSNSTSFVASLTIIALLLSRMLADIREMPPWWVHTTMVLDIVALLGAYAAGSDRESHRSFQVILLVPIVVLIVFAFLFVSWGEKAITVERHEQLEQEQEQVVQVQEHEMVG